MSLSSGLELFLDVPFEPVDLLLLEECSKLKIWKKEALKPEYHLFACVVYGVLAAP